MNKSTVYNEPHLLPSDFELTYQPVIPETIDDNGIIIVSDDLIAFPNWEESEQWFRQHGCESMLLYVVDTAHIVSDNLIKVLE